MELNEQQKQAVEYNGTAKNILVTAGAGCGKTKTIISRVAHLIKSGASPSRILMMTFTNRAAREMKARLKGEIGQLSSQLHAGTFHSFCLKVMTKIPNSFDIAGLNIIDTDDQNSLMTIIRKQYLGKINKDQNKGFPKSSELIKYYSYSRNTCQEPRMYLLNNSDLNEHHIELCCNIFKEYQMAKIVRGYLDYDDLLEIFSISLSKKTELKKAVTRLFDEILVDEMQDTNQLQFSILKHFNENAEKDIIKILSDHLGAKHDAIKAYTHTLSQMATPKNCVFNAVRSLTPILKEKYDNWNYRSQDLNLLVNVSERYRTISNFIDAFTLEPMTSSEIEKLEIDDAVILITVHSAKGTEAPICFVANAKQGTYPHSRSFGDLEAEEEERRVLYVALTRAKNELYITRSSDFRSGFYIQNKPAAGEEYFLSDIPSDLVTKEVHRWSPDNAKGLSSLRDIY